LRSHSPALVLGEDQAILRHPGLQRLQAAVQRPPATRTRNATLAATIFGSSADGDLSRTFGRCCRLVGDACEARKEGELDGSLLSQRSDAPLEAKERVDFFGKRRRVRCSRLLDGKGITFAGALQLEGLARLARLKAS
jgi:hypothetical protein